MSVTIPLDPQIATVLDLAPWAQPAEGGIVSRTLISTTQLRVVHFTFAPGQELTEHTSTRRAIAQVLAGECDFKINGAWSRLVPGAVLHMPPHHRHAVRAAHGSCSLLLTLVTEPESARAAATTDAASEANG